MLGRALTSVAWGMVADRYGRKPVIVIGTIAVLVLTTIFQLSLNVFFNTSKMSPFFFFLGLFSILSLALV
jgi:MFS family permease